ncbi:hypothetical protein ACF5W4_10870 [Bacillota bacterium Lsc_1132]
MYRFSIKGEEWILRFSPQTSVGAEEKQEILTSLLHIEMDLLSYFHGETFMMLDKKFGAIVFIVERIPSFILTVSTIIPVERWYIQDPTLKLFKSM